MSKLIDRLEKVGVAAPAPMGFGANRVVEKAPALLLVALSDTKSRASTSQFQADSYIMSAEKVTKAELKAAKEIAGDAPWGLWPKTITNDSLNILKGQGADFFVLSTVNTPAEVLAVEEPSRLITIPADFPEELGHSLEEIPVDAVILAGLEESSPLSVKDLMQVRSMRDLISKPLLLLRCHALTQGELVVLRDVGVQGIVLDMRTIKVEDAAQIRKDIEELPPRKIRRDQPNALLPRLSQQLGSPEEEEQEEEED